MNITPEVEDLFHQLADLDKEQRARYFDEHPTGPDTRHQVETLLACDRSTESGLRYLVQEQAAATMNTAASQSGCELCGPYRLIRLIGQGGMAEVWLAERVDGFVKRNVALKLPYAGIHASQFAERTHRERDILASLVHPGIARLYDAGIAEGGRPFLALEFVEGTNLTAYCDARRLNLRERLRLFLQILNAVQHAHSRLVIHRDLKPSNILITNDGEAKLLDFGIAKLMIEGEALETELTQRGGRVLTLNYASPEQISGQPVTTASDVFSLGTILFELLSGERPFVPKRDSRGALEEAILAAEPKRPSQAVDNESRARSRSTTLRRLKSALRGDLDLIVIKALQKQPEQRYATADAFRADIERYLGGEPVLAQPESLPYRARKFVLRHKLAAASGAVVFLSLAMGLSLALWQARVARDEARTSAAVEEFTEDIFRANSLENPDPVKARQTTARQLLDIGARKATGGLRDAPQAKLRMLGILASLYVDFGLDDQAVALHKQRVAVAKTLYGERDPAIVPMLVELGAAMDTSRSANEEEGVLLEAKRILDRSGDFRSQTRAFLLSYLAQHYENTDLQKSLALAKESVDVYRRFPPSNAFAEALYMTGAAYLYSEDSAHAEAFFNQAIATSKKVNGDPNSHLARYYSLQARAESNQMRYSAAEHNLRLALKAAMALGGDEDVDTLQAESRLGMLLVSTSRLREGLPYLQRAKDVCLRTRGPDDPYHTPQMLRQYGLALAANGQPEEALYYLSRAVENRRRTRPGTRPLGQMLEDQASILIDLGRYRKAEQVLDEALVIRQKVGEKIDAEYLTPRIRLALDLGKADDAAGLVKRHYGAVTDSTALSLELLDQLEVRAKVALLKNDGRAAVATAARSREAIVSSPLQPYLKTRQARAMLEEGEGYLIEHDPTKALPLLEGAAKTATELFDSNSPDIATAEAALGICYLDLGNLAKATNLFLRSQSVLQAHRELGESYRRPVRELGRRLARPQ